MLWSRVTIIKHERPYVQVQDIVRWIPTGWISET